MDGLEVQRQLHVSEAGLPIIFVSAHENRKRRQIAMDLVASHFFQKPFVPADLLAAVDAALKQTQGWSEDL